MNDQPFPVGCVERCRGCTHRNLSEDQSLAQKKDFLTRTLATLWDGDIFLEGPPATQRLGYRKKSVQAVIDGKIGMKIKAQSRDQDDEVLEIPDCPVHTAQVNEVYRLIRDSFPSDIPLAYVTQMGNLIGFVLKESENQEHLKLVRTWTGKVLLPVFQALGVFINFHPSTVDRVFFHKGWHHVAGIKSGSGRLLGRDFLHGPSGFMQVGEDLYEKALYRTANFFNLGLDRSAAVIDLYSGLGVSLSLWKQSVSEVIGVELSQESIQFAVRNGVNEVLRGKCEERIPQLQEFLNQQGKVSLFCNPPRLGLEASVTYWIAKNRQVIPKISYLSCSPGTLSRDLKILVESGYRIRSINAYDFFPQTLHVETLVLLESS